MVLFEFLGAGPETQTLKILWCVYTFGTHQAGEQEHLSRKVDTLVYSMSKASTKVNQKVTMNDTNIIISNNILPHPARATDEAVFIPKFDVYFMA